MKQIIALIISLMMLLTLSACVVAQDSDGREKKRTEGAKPQTEPTSTVQHKTENELWQEEYDQANNHCKELVAAGDYAGALNYSKEKAKRDTRYEPLYSQYADFFVEKKLEEAKECANARNFAKAVEVLEAANDVYGCMEFTSAIEEYQELLPRKLSMCYLIEESSYTTLENAWDCFGTTYQSVFGFETTAAYPIETGDLSGYAVFFLDEKFVKLSGTFALRDNIRNEGSATCKIYGDGELLYESPNLAGRTSYPVSVNVDITGVKQLRVEGSCYGGAEEKCYHIMDFTVS